jgi:membrane protease YdiL (CAAX protease family)
MISDASKSPQQVIQPPADAGGAPPPDDRFAARLRGFGPLGIFVSLVVLALGPILEPYGPLASLLWVRLSRTPWREIGFVRPKSWTVTVAVGLAFGIAFKFLMKALVMPLFGAPVLNPEYHYLVGNTAALPEMAFVMIFGAGFGEETVFRGFLFERLGKLLGRSVGAKAVIVLLSSVLFGLVHYPAHGFFSAEQAVMTGLVFGTIFAVTGRIWMVMVAHASFDLTALAIIYWNVETKVAHLVFR